MLVTLSLTLKLGKLIHSSTVFAQFLIRDFAMLL